MRKYEKNYLAEQRLQNRFIQLMKFPLIPPPKSVHLILLNFFLSKNYPSQVLVLPLMKRGKSQSDLVGKNPILRGWLPGTNKMKQKLNSDLQVQGLASPQQKIGTFDMKKYIEKRQDQNNILH